MTGQTQETTSPKALAGSSKARILVIDDSPSVILHTRRILGPAGHTIETLERLVDLPKQVKENPPDLVILDLHMPALLGVTVAGFIRQYQSSPIPIVVYSSRPRKEIDEAAVKIDAAGVVEKGSPDFMLVTAVIAPCAKPVSKNPDMNVAPGTLPESDLLIRLVAQMVTERYGIVVPPYRFPVLQAVFEDLGGESLSSGVRRLTMDENEAWSKLITAIAVCETYFFRHAAQFEVFQQFVQERASERKTTRVLSAGCSTGEEVWSVAAILASLPAVADDQHRVLGWDLSQGRLQHAINGTYGKWACRKGFFGYDRFFVKEGKSWTVAPSLRTFADFNRVNLTSRRLNDSKTGSGFDVIFFRNVSIYWTMDTTERVLSNLMRLLKPSGLLLPGPSDPVPLPSATWKQTFRGGARVFRRRDPNEDERPKTKTTRLTIQKGSVQGKATRPEPYTMAGTPLRPKPAPPTRPSATMKRRLTSAEPRPTAFTHTDKMPVDPPENESIPERIRSLADNGDYEAALELLQKSDSESSPENLLWEGILLLNVGREENAVISLRKCVYLEPDQAVYRRWLAVAYDAVGDETEAAREHRNAAELEAK